MTPFMMLDLGITIFLISYASDMVSLLVSSLGHPTTTAMTVMPFILIFQLVFSGGVFNLPAWTSRISNLTISNYGMKCMMAECDYNNTPMVTGWNTLVNMEDNTIDIDVTVGQLLEYSGHTDGVMGRIREQ